MMAGTAFADKGGHHEGKGKPDQTVTGSVYVKEDEKEVKVKVTDDTYKDTVTGSVYGGAHGLINAYGNVKDKPAGERIAALLKSKYGIEVNSDTDLNALVDSLAKQGKVQAAADAQAEVAATDASDIEQVKKLAKLKVKLGQKGVKAFVNGKETKFDVSPVIESGRTLVPFRAISEALNAEVTWEATVKTVIVKRDGIEVKLVLGSKTATVNGKQVTLDVPGKLKSNRVLVPMRFLSEALDSKVVWDAETSSVIVVD
jgi:hypothetical protein